MMRTSKASGPAGLVPFTDSLAGEAHAPSGPNRWYDSSVGRWLSEDPIGFEGNDPNLGRYVGNAPALHTDPIGLFWSPPFIPTIDDGGGPTVPPPGETTPNVRYPLNSHKTAPVGTKAKLQEKFGDLPVFVLRRRDTSTTVYTGQAKGSIYRNVGPSQYRFGTTNLGPCVGLIVVGPLDEAGNRHIFVYHFEVGDKPITSMDGFPRGSHAAVFGGQNDNPHSCGLMQDVVDALEWHRVRIDGIFNASGVWVDTNGLYFTHAVPDLTSAEDDGTIPRPLPFPSP